MTGPVIAGSRLSSAALESRGRDLEGERWLHAHDFIALISKRATGCICEAPSPTAIRR